MCMPVFPIFCCFTGASLHEKASVHLASGVPVTLIPFQSLLSVAVDLLLLLRSQLYLWGSPFWVRFLCMGPCFNPTIEVVTFRVRG